MIISNSEKDKLEQKDWNKLFIIKTSTSECGHYIYNRNGIYGEELNVYDGSAILSVL